MIAALLERAAWRLSRPGREFELELRRRQEAEVVALIESLREALEELRERLDEEER